MGHKLNENADPLAPKKPDWKQWKSAKTAKLWQAIALACDLAPSNFGIFEMMGKLNSQDLALQYPTFSTLLEWARKDLGPNGRLKAVTPCVASLENSEVSLSSFATWLKSTPHAPPKEFPWAAEEIPLYNLDWPWGRHETALLRQLATAAAKFWKNYDPSDPSTAPTNKQVIDWLKAQGVADRTAEVMASILRADGLPTGPRK